MRYVGWLEKCKDLREVQCSVCEHPNFDEVQVMKDTIKISIMAKWCTLQGRVNWTSL